jgi:ribonuclease HI
MFHFHEAHGTVVFWWVPGHTSLPGNEVTDVATKEAAVLRNLTSD